MLIQGTIQAIKDDLDGATIEIKTARIESHLNAIAELKNDMVDIDIKKHRNSRSLDANRCLWHCLGEIAATLNADKWDIYLQMLKRYGKYTYIVVKENAVEAMKAQWRESEVVGEIDIHGEKAVQMLCYFGSSTYNTKEFSVLLDGVVSEMKEMGLTPPTPEHIRLMLEEYAKHETK